MKQDRRARLCSLENEPPIDVLIVGGGINGAGLFRELALQGLRVVLVEKCDYASGASCATSRMVHGGLRYLENGEFDLVTESLAERNRLLKNAPHAVAPMPTNIPIYTRFTGIGNSIASFLKLNVRPSRRGSLIVKIGLSFYDFLTRKSSPMPRHDFRSKSEALKRFPSLDPEIICSSRYFDACVQHPERLCLELILDAQSNAPKATALNYVSLSRIQDGHLVLNDELTQSNYQVKPQVLVNATGAWIDFTNKRLDLETKYIGGTKGSHLIIDHPTLREELDDEMFFYENADHRICILLPFGKHLLLGTTDLRVSSPEEAVCSPEETRYLLAAANQLFPEAKLNDSHIIATFCGVRPLPATDGSSTGRISRSHSFPAKEARADFPFPMYSLVGGKWTTFRSFAEQVADSILSRLKATRVGSTADRPIGGGSNYPQSEAEITALQHSVSQKCGISVEQSKRLFERYGTQFENYIGDDNSPIVADYTRAELVSIIQREDVCHLLDLVLRRTRIAFSGELTLERLDEISKILEEESELSPVDSASQKEQTLQQLASKHAIRL